MPDPIENLPPLRDVIARHGLGARKSLGQHFLLDLNLTARICSLAGDARNGTVFEIGPGPGGLTRAILSRGAVSVVAIEKDQRCIEALQDLVTAAAGRLTLLEQDALTFDLSSYGEPPRHIIANLPYNVATPLLISWLRQADAISSMTLMFQKEVADRIVAAPGSRTYGRLSVLTNWRCKTHFAFTVPARAFTPPPKVDSAIVTLTPYDTPPYPAKMKTLERITAAAFGQRRKMLRRALKTLGTETEDLLCAAGISPTARAEEISVEGFAALARAYEDLQTR